MSTTPAQRAFNSVAWVAGMFLVAMIAIGVTYMIVRSIVGDRPMPCSEEEVYVWEDYPDDARCVSDVDHEDHVSVDYVG